jgi:D-alanyl-D-alanine carboxypeptidase
MDARYRARVSLNIPCWEDLPMSAVTRCAAKWCVLAGLISALPVWLPGTGGAPAGSTACAEHLEPAPAARLQALLDSCIDHDGDAPVHNAILLIESPGFKWKGAAGLADGKAEPMTPDHKFKIASISKTMTAAVVLQLVEEGRLDLDDTLGELLPENPFVKLDTLEIYQGVPVGRRVTIRNLLDHTSGLACFMSRDPRFLEYVIEHPQTHWTPAMMMDKYYEYHLNRKPAFAPGEGWEYSDTDYVLLGLIIEKVTGTTLHEQYRRRIYEPLGLENTYLEFYEEPRGRAPLSHAYYGGVDINENVDTSFDWGGGGIVSTLDELNRFYRALLNGRLFESPATLDAMLAGTADEERWNYGLGIKRMMMNGHAFYGHPGAYSCDAYYCPAKDVSVVLTINQMDSRDRKENLRKHAVDVVLPEAK